MKLPPPLTMTNLVADLIGQRVTSRPAAATRPDPKKQMTATYRNEAGALVAAAFCDLQVGASFAAALTMMPPGRVDDCVKDGHVDAILRENLHEVFNVLSAAFPMAGAPRVILGDLHCQEEAPAEVAALIASPGGRVDLDITVGGYRSGRFALLAA